MIDDIELGKKKDELAAWSHHIMAAVGGFMGCYAIVTRSDVFGNAQTMNLICLVKAIIGMNWRETLLRFLALVIYVTAIFLYVYIRDVSKISEKSLAILIDAAALILMAFIPLSVTPIVSVYPIFFAAAFQWSAFPGSYGYVSATVFSTNNTKQATVSFAEFLIHHDPQKLHRMRFYLGSLGGFHIGVALCVVAIMFLHIKSSLAALLLLIPAWILVQREAKIHTEIE